MYEYIHLQTQRGKNSICLCLTSPSTCSTSSQVAYHPDIPKPVASCALTLGICRILIHYLKEKLQICNKGLHLGLQTKEAANRRSKKLKVLTGRSRERSLTRTIHMDLLDSRINWSKQDKIKIPILNITWRQIMPIYIMVLQFQPRFIKAWEVSTILHSMSLMANSNIISMLHSEASLSLCLRMCNEFLRIAIVSKQWKNKIIISFNHKPHLLWLPVITAPNLNIGSWINLHPTIIKWPKCFKILWWRISRFRAIAKIVNTMCFRHLPKSSKISFTKAVIRVVNKSLSLTTNNGCSCNMLVRTSSTRHPLLKLNALLSLCKSSFLVSDLNSLCSSTVAWIHVQYMAWIVKMVNKRTVRFKVRRNQQDRALLRSTRKRLPRMSLKAVQCITTWLSWHKRMEMWYWTSSKCQIICNNITICNHQAWQATRCVDKWLINSFLSISSPSMPYHSTIVKRFKIIRNKM